MMPTHCHLSQTTRQHYRVDRREIAFIRYVLEAYDGVAVVKTLDSQVGLIEFQIAFANAFEGIIEQPNEQESVCREMAIHCLG